jgi:hypothetical protein
MAKEMPRHRLRDSRLPVNTCCQAGCDAHPAVQVPRGFGQASGLWPGPRAQFESSARRTLAGDADLRGPHQLRPEPEFRKIHLPDVAPWRSSDFIWTNPLRGLPNAKKVNNSTGRSALTLEVDRPRCGYYLAGDHRARRADAGQRPCLLDVCGPRPVASAATGEGGPGQRCAGSGDEERASVVHVQHQRQG